MKTVLITACAAALLLSAGAVSAQSPQRASRIDADADGRVSRAEFLSRLDRMAAADADHDGSITPDERRAAMQTRVAQRRDAAFTRLDADRDGSISRAEFEARSQGVDRASRARMGGHGARRMHRSPEGATSPRGERTIDVAQARERMSQAFARLDKDNDGYLTAEERRAGRMERGQHRRDMRRPSPAAPASE